jgi:hypothetical protein
MTQEELVSGAEAKHNDWMPVQAIANPAPDGECLKFTYCQRVDVADAPSVEMAPARRSNMHHRLDILRR